MKTNIFKTELIANYMKSNNLSKNKFCKLCKISPQSFDKIFDCNLTVGLKVVYKITRTIDIRLCEFFCDKHQQ